MSVTVESLLQHPALWRVGGGGVAARRIVVPSGFAGLDARLPGGGWPHPALIEVLNDHPGVGELSLLLPALRHAEHERAGVRAPTIAWINPPHVPYPPALAEHGLDPARLLMCRSLTSRAALWAMEQSLRSGACAAVLAWVEGASPHALRRLKLAASEGACLGFLFRTLRHRAHSSPATVRLALSVDGTALVVELLKVQGGKAATVKLSAN